MEDTKMLVVLTVVQAMHCATAMFFHEPSNLVAQGSGAAKNSDFGFAMAYRYNLRTLVVGAPKADQIGKVFNCEIYDKRKILCGEQYIDYAVSEYNIEKFRDQRFYLGSSIVATNEYFFTCAPLWTTNINATDEKGKKVLIADTFGTCFKQDQDTTRYQGLLEYYIKSRAKKKGFIPIRSPLAVERFTGGTGWSTLLDEKNDLLLIAKTSFKGDISYVPASNATHDVKSLVEKYRNDFAKRWNIGFGLAAGKFFSNETVYAFSMLPNNMEGLISFLVYKRRSKDFSLSMLTTKKADANNKKVVIVIELTSQAVGTMFGYTMSSADLNFDGLDELLVGAPAQSEDECYECGALHIYTGGDMKTINEAKRLRSIFGTSHFGRFGSVIVAKDIDGDGRPELVVSAPYENHGSGAIYILSGYELYFTLMKTQEFKSIQLSDLKLTQKLQKESYRTLGFSLQFVEDVDGNGCDELAAGSPGSSTVLIFKCVRKINVTLSTELIGEQIVREQDMNFTVKVCARVEYPLLPDEIVGNVTIESSIIGEAAVVLQPDIVIDISCDSCFNQSTDYCENVTVSLSDKDPGDYIFKSTAELQNSYLSDRNTTVFNKTWVEASLYSKLNTSLRVSRHCKGDDCIPRLSFRLDWSGSDPYLLGSSANETVKITVRNDGNASYGACVWLQVYGAPLGLVGCENYNDGYRCSLPTPLKRGSNFSLDLELTMTDPTNNQKFLRVVVHLYENCNKESVYRSNSLKIEYVLTSDGVSNDGDNHKLNITDKQILENATVYDHHEFPIRNNGSIIWSQVKFIVSMEKKPYINSFNISEASCNTSNEDSNFIIHHCTFTKLLPNTTNTIIGTTEILAGRLNGYRNGAEIEMKVSSILHLSDGVPDLAATSVTTITIQKEITWASRKWLIAVIAGAVAFIILAILTFILCRMGFFRRKQKQKLIVMQESVRRKSVRRNTHVSAMDGPMEGLQIDVGDDCPFEDTRTGTTKDNVGLVEHNEP